MTMTTVNSDLARADALMAAAVEGCESVDATLGSLCDEELVGLVTEVEVLARRVGVLQLAVMDQIDNRGLFRVDGHVSAKVMVRHLYALSPGEAASSDKARRVDYAVEVASRAFESWSQTSLSRRSQVLFSFRELLNAPTNESWQRSSQRAR